MERTIVDELEAIFAEIEDFTKQQFQTDVGEVTVLFLQSLVDIERLERTVIKPLLANGGALWLKKEIQEEKIAHCVEAIDKGETIVYYEKADAVYKINTFSPQFRGVMTSETESTVIGPQDSFTESLQTNVSLIQRRIHSPKLKTKNLTVGSDTSTTITIICLEHVVNRENLRRLEHRIEEIDYPGFTDIVMLKQLLEDNPLSPFPQFAFTTRPDHAVMQLLDGRIVVAMENSSMVMICPTSFLEMFFSMEDYYNRWTTASLLRILRFSGFFITIMLTPLYISILTYHPGLMPFELLMMLQESRSRVPFPPVIETLFIELVIEILREAGARMPTKIGQTIGIVGGIVIGTAAVEAGLVSNTLIVLVAISALLSFLLPNYLMSNASRLIRYIFILSAGIFGMFGQMLALAWLINHLLNLTSLGTPYMTPIIPRKKQDLLDSLIRFPLVYLQNKKGMSRAATDRRQPGKEGS